VYGHTASIIKHYIPVDGSYIHLSVESILLVLFSLIFLYNSLFNKFRNNDREPVLSKASFIT